MEDKYPIAPPNRPDLRETWAIVKEMEQRSIQGYREAAQRIRRRLEAYDDIGLAELAEIHRMLETELKSLEQEQNGLLFQGMLAAAAAAVLGVRGGRRNEQMEHLVVRQIIDTPHSDGLNLSARLWRIHAGAAHDLKQIVDIAVQRGWDAEHTVQHIAKMTPELRQALQEAGGSTLGKRVENGLLHDPNNAAVKFRRVLRTEINRAHRDNYERMVFEDEDVIGTRFMLSPRHPRPDICDIHATADLYGLGEGVYPKGANPCPAHPNTFSYIEAVRKDEIGSKNRTVNRKPDDMPEMVWKIRQRDWGDGFKQRAEEAYRYFEKHGMKLDIHAVGRIDRLDRFKTYIPLTKEDVAEFFLNAKPNFVDIKTDRWVYFSAEKQLTLVQSKTDGMIVTVERDKRPKGQNKWKRITPEDY